MYVIHKTNASALALFHLLLRSAQAFSRNIFALSIINQNVIFVMNIRQPRLNVMRLFACSDQSKLMPSSKLFLTQLSFNPLFRIFFERQDIYRALHVANLPIFRNKFTNKRVNCQMFWAFPNVGNLGSSRLDRSARAAYHKHCGVASEGLVGNVDSYDGIGSQCRGTLFHFVKCLCPGFVQDFFVGIGTTSDEVAD
jgi:hypothetical protein